MVALDSLRFQQKCIFFKLSTCTNLFIALFTWYIFILEYESCGGKLSFSSSIHIGGDIYPMEL